MSELTRRGFLRTASVGTAAFGILSVLPGMAFAQEQPSSQDQSDGGGAPADGGAMPASAPAPAPAPVEAATPWLLYVRDADRGELAILSGEQELVFTDPGLLAKIQQVAA